MLCSIHTCLDNLLVLICNAKETKAMFKNVLYRFAFSKILVIFLCAALLGGITISLANDAFAFVKKSRHITFSLDEPTSLYDISNQLQNSGVI